MRAYYNELDPFAAQWLRNLIAAGHIAPGEVDERSIAEVQPDDLVGFTQCHFFAGIGVWSYALRLAGWPDDRHVWTGSCPCQPFSSAGKGDGAADPRHLWPAWVRLIRECQPHTIFGEQVSGRDGLAWLDLVHADLEARDYAVGAVTLPAASVGAPHGRHRIFFVADASDVRREQLRPEPRGADEGEGQGRLRESSGGGPDGGVADAEHAERRAEREGDGATHGRDGLGRSGDVGRVADPDGGLASDGRVQRSGEHGQQPQDGGALLMGHASGQGLPQRARNGRVQYEAMEPHAGEAVERGGDAGGVGDANSDSASEVGTGVVEQREQRAADWGRSIEHAGAGAGSGSSGGHGPEGIGCRIPRDDGAAGILGGFWADADWLYCRDGKWRPVEPGSFPLVDGAPARVGRLRAYGNAICPHVAAAFIGAAMMLEPPPEARP